MPALGSGYTHLIAYQSSNCGGKAFACSRLARGPSGPCHALQSKWNRRPTWPVLAPVPKHFRVQMRSSKSRPPTKGRACKTDAPLRSTSRSGCRRCICLASRSGCRENSRKARCWPGWPRSRALESPKREQTRFDCKRFRLFNLLPSGPTVAGRGRVALARLARLAQLARLALRRWSVASSIARSAPSQSKCARFPATGCG